MVKARSWDAVGIVTVGLLGILGVRRRSESTFLGPRTAPTSPISGRCIVTGASSGMGTELVNELVNAGAEEVVMACRSLRRCEKTRELLFRRCLDVDKAGSPAARRRHCREMQRKMVCKALDLTSARSIRAFIKDSVQGGKQPVILVNNGGVMADEKQESPGNPQVDLQLRTNHLGHFMLTQMLLPHMDPTSSLIVVMASRAHCQGSITLEHGKETQVGFSGPENTFTSRLLHAIGLGWYARYARSKLCNVLFAAELRRKYPEGPLSIAISPGLVNTGIFRSVPEPLGQVLRLATKSFQTPAEGAQHVMQAISAAQQAKCAAVEFAEVTDQFPLYWHCSRPQKPSRVSMDESLAEAVWRASEVAVEEVL